MSATSEPHLRDTAELRPAKTFHKQQNPPERAASQTQAVEPTRTCVPCLGTRVKAWFLHVDPPWRCALPHGPWVRALVRFGKSFQSSDKAMAELAGQSLCPRPAVPFFRLQAVNPKLALPVNHCQSDTRDISCHFTGQCATKTAAPWGSPKRLDRELRDINLSNLLAIMCLDLASHLSILLSILWSRLRRSPLFLALRCLLFRD